jgi:hypothetical protein
MNGLRMVPYIGRRASGLTPVKCLIGIDRHSLRQYAG